MPKIIAFYGSPGSGKTTVAFKTALLTYSCTPEAKILFLSPDMTVPSIALLFPNYRPEEVLTLGQILDATDVGETAVFKNMVTVERKEDFACLGFKSGDNILSYPTPTDDKIDSLFRTLKGIADYIIVDCTDRSDDKISKRALLEAEVKFRVISADPKGMAWFSSMKTVPSFADDKAYNIVNTLEKDLFLATEEVCSTLGTVIAIMPYSKGIKQQMIDGRLYEDLKDRAYNNKLEHLLSKII